MGFVSTFVSLPFYFVLLYGLLAKSAATAMTWTISGQISFGLAMGYVFASLAESWQHRFFGHQATRLRSLLWRIPGGFGFRLKRAYWLHNIIHHIRTHKANFVTLFSSDTEKRELHATLRQSEIDFAEYREYGLSVPLSSYPLFMWLPMMIIPILYRYVGSWAAFSSFPPMVVAPALSMWIHPLVHRPYATVLRETTGLLHWFMQTSYARKMIRHHWMHHHYPNYNFNLMLLGDFLLGTHRSPSAMDLQRMIEDKVPID